MTAFAILAIIVFVFIATKAYRDKRDVDIHAIAQLRHARTGDYPSSCSWCKGTSLARRLIMFSRNTGNWQSVDVMSQLQSCLDNDVGALSRVLTHDQPQWRRLCTERCAKEFFLAEHVVSPETFEPCEYCSTRLPRSLIRCSNCGATRTSNRDAARQPAA